MNYKKVDKNVPDLMHATEHSAGLDLCVTQGLDFSDTNTFTPTTAMVGTGIAVEIPEGQVGLVFVRSSIGTKRGITLANGTGVIDSDYRGEIMLALNFSSPAKIEAYERVAQLVVVPYTKVSPTLVTELNTTHRGVGGFGSTGQ